MAAYLAHRFTLFHFEPLAGGGEGERCSELALRFLDAAEMPYWISVYCQIFLRDARIHWSMIEVDY